MTAAARANIARQWVAIGQAKATQVQRVNDRAADQPAPDDDAAALRELRAANAALLDQLADAQRLIDDLKAQLDDAPRRVSASPLHRIGEGQGVGTIPRRMVDALTGRPIGTQTAYARLHDVKPYTVSRAVKAGKISTCGRYVYLDQTIPVKGY
jgi:hypothetical protein